VPKQLNQLFESSLQLITIIHGKLCPQSSLILSFMGISIYLLILNPKPQKIDQTQMQA
jgi:hypothetical protein